MDPASQEKRLSRMKTQWTALFQAHRPEGDAAGRARRELLLHYHAAVQRYLLGMLRDATAAEELAQDFAVRFLRGDFKQADPERGRFRDFLKTSLRRLVFDHWGRKQRAVTKEAGPLPKDSGMFPAAPATADADEVFDNGWREELLARTWDALAEAEIASGAPFHAVLRFKVAHPDLRTAQLAEQLGPLVGRTFTEAGLRQLVHRARDRFADLLIDEVGRSLETADEQAIEQELIDLHLLDYCRSALKRRAGTG
jgi:DNA-directed RNA polymerase specialized sigma24 family protein